jgi:hypothetical protein
MSCTLRLLRQLGEPIVIKKNFHSDARPNDYIRTASVILNEASAAYYTKKGTGYGKFFIHKSGK